MTNKKKAVRSQRKQKTKRINPEGALLRAHTGAITKMASFVDQSNSGTIGTSVLQYTLLYGLLGTSGLLSTYPQHAKPTFRTGAKGLRQRIRLTAMEFTFYLVGSQGNLVLGSDVYNTIRLAVFDTKVNYTTLSVDYLTGVLTGTNLQETNHVYHDQIYPLMTQAWSPASDTSPGVKSGRLLVRLNKIVDCFSIDSAGTTWDTNGYDLILNVVSDSSITPHPSYTVHSRIWFDWM